MSNRPGGPKERAWPERGMARLGLNRWTLSLTVVLFVLGLFLSVQWRWEREKPAAQELGTREVYGATLKRLEEEQKQLKGNVERLQKEVRSYQELASQRKDTMGELAEELRLQRIAAGLVPLKGPGTKVTLDDSKRPPAPSENPNLYIIHDYQLRDVVNLLWHGGAEAISINAERLVGTTSIYSSGGTIMVNSTRLSPPFVVQALGDQDRMMEVLGRPSSLRTLKAQSEAYGLGLSFQKEREMVVPAFLGPYATKFLSVGRP